MERRPDLERTVKTGLNKEKKVANQCEVKPKKLQKMMQFFFVSVVSLVLQIQDEPQLEEGMIVDEEEAQNAQENQILLIYRGLTKGIFE